MSLTVDQLNALPLGYLTGADLSQFSAPQLLIKQYEVNSNSLFRGCSLAYSEVIAALSTRYDLSAEMAKLPFLQGSATAVLSGDGVGSVAINYGGQSYGSIPTLSFTGGNGSGATATAVLTEGVITAINVTAPGSGYTSAPAVTISGGSSPDTRLNLLVKIVSILSVRNALANFQNIAESMLNNFAWADKTLKDIRNGQMNLVLPLAAISIDPDTGELIGNFSSAELIRSSFQTIG